MSYKSFSSALRVSTNRYSSQMPLIRDETLEEQRTRRAKELERQQKLHRAWVKENNAMLS